MSGDRAGFIGVGVLNSTCHRFLFHQPVFLADFGTMKYDSLCVIRCPSWCCPSGCVADLTTL